MLFALLRVNRCTIEDRYLRVEIFSDVTKVRPAHFWTQRCNAIRITWGKPLLDKYNLLLYNLTVMTRCFTMLKPGVLNRRIVGEVINRLERKGLKLVALKLMQIDEKLAKNHYAEHVEKPFFGELVSYITSAPVVAMVWQGDDCVNLVRKLVGSTKPSEAAPGTIRGDFCLHTQFNVIHASDSDASADREINLFFNENEIIDWEDNSSSWL